jgi:hypothetical protein
MVLIADVALAGAVLLVAAGVRHLVHGPGVIDGHGLLPPWLIRLVLPAEPLIGAALITAWSAGSPEAVRYAGVVTALWHAALAVYLAVLLRTRGRVECGCLDSITKVSPVKIVIGGALAATSAVMAAGFAVPPEDFLSRLLHLPMAAFVAVLTVAVSAVADLMGTSDALRR